MRVLVLYFSMTGNTESIAEAIAAETLGLGHQALLATVAGTRPAAITDSDLVFLGAACHDSDLALPAKRMLETLPMSPALKMAGFATHAAPLPEGGSRNVLFYERWAAGCERTFEQASRQKGFGLVGYFSCQGAPSTPIEDFVHREILPNPVEFAEYLTEARKHPTTEDLRQAKRFARRVLTSC